MNGMIQEVVQLLILCAFGFVLCRTSKSGFSFKGPFSTFLIDLVVPCYVIKTMGSMEFSHGILQESFVMMAAAVIVMALLLLLGSIGCRMLGGGNHGRLFRYAMTFNNASIFGLPVVEAAWGELALFYFVVFFIPFRFGYYCLANVLLSSEAPQDVKGMLNDIQKMMISPPMLACVLGLLMYSFQFTLPATLFNAISSVSDCLTATGMILVGMIIADFEFKTFLKKKYLLIPIFKNMIIPAVMLVLVHLTHVNGILGRIIVAYSALPVATLLGAFSVRFISDAETQLESASAILLSTVLGLVTVPMWIAIINTVIPL